MKLTNEKIISNESSNKGHYINEKSNNSTTFFLFITVVVTSIATSIISISIISDNWEYVKWNGKKIHQVIEDLEQNNRQYKIKVVSFFENSVTKISVFDHKIIEHSNAYLQTNRPTAEVFLLPMHSGIWTICITINDAEEFILHDFPSKKCFNYLSTELLQGGEIQSMADWNHRMQNVSASCAIVSLIILASAAFVGIFGILKHQLSAVLVTGVMYLLAGTFALFTIMIIYFKRMDGRRTRGMTYQNTIRIKMDDESEIMDYGILQKVNIGINVSFSNVWNPYYPAREFYLGWSFNLAIVGVILALISSIVWITMAKILRNSPPAAVQL